MLNNASKPAPDQTLNIAQKIFKKSLSAASGSVLTTLLFITAGQQIMADESVCSATSKQDFIESCWYVGIGVGASDIEVNDDDEWLTSDNEDTAGYVALGNRFKPNWFVELRLTDLGSADVAPKDQNDTRTDNVEYSMTDLSVGYTLFGAPERMLNVYGKAGLGLLANHVDQSEINITREVTAEVTLGVGAQVRFADRYFARLEVNTYGEDIQAAFISLNRYFGN